MDLKAIGYFLTAPNTPFERREFFLSAPAIDEVIVQVAGCGLCHTDISFYTGSVGTKQPLPLVLGHEISGKVVVCSDNYKHLEGKNVIIPAVLPCGECDLCKMGRDNICQKQKMPGNDFHGGFATHIKVPARFLCVLPSDLKSFQLSQFSVVADAITTPYQSLVRSGLKKGELAIVIGVGGVGTYMVQHAKNVGASVIALDIDDNKLAHAKKMGADLVLNTKGKSEKDLKQELRTWAQEHKMPKNCWKIFEMSGTGAGQTTAFSLLNFAGTLGVIGFTMDKINLRLSNVMAFDADIFGNWGCRPQYYSDVVQGVLNKKINILDNIEEHPLESINDVLKLALEHKLEKRAILKA